MVWYKTPGPRRVPLTTAIIRDEGKTWANTRDLESDEAQIYAYTSITFTGDEALITYCFDHRSLKLKIVPVDRFYEETDTHNHVHNHEANTSKPES